MAEIYHRTKHEIQFLLSHKELLTEWEVRELLDAMRSIDLDLSLRDRDQERDRLLGNYFYFFQRAWTYVDDHPLLLNWHIKLMCDHLQAVQERSPFSDLVINVPPGCSKSMNASVIWPAWCLARNPRERILAASYDSDLVKKQSVDSKDLINSEWYQAFFGETVRVRPDVDTQGYWETTAGGWRFSTTPRGRATGRHPNLVICFPGGTLIETDRGRAPIEDVVASPESYLVRGGSGDWKRIVRVYKRRTKGLVEIKHEFGVFACTPNHPIWVDGRGWTDADAIFRGDRLRALGERVSSRQFFAGLIMPPSVEPDAAPVLPWEYARQLEISRVVATAFRETSCDVFNLEVEEDNTYFAEGVLVHNCDDLHSVQKAESKTERQATVDWWDKTMVTRGAGKTMNRARVVIGQRIHKQDVPGHILETDTNNQWARLILPMRYEPGRMRDLGVGTDPRKVHGELLWPEMFPEDSVRETERRLGPYGTAGQLQQRPTSHEGAIFKIDQVKIVPADQVPWSAIIRVKRAWDLAGTKDDGDFTAGAEGGITSGKFPRFFVFDMAHGQWSTDECLNQMKLWAKLGERRYGFSKFETVFELEPGASGKQAAAETIRRLRGHRARSVRADKKKEVRAEPLANAIAAGEVYFVDGPWVQGCIEEMRYFPKVDHDDRVDALSLLYLELVRGSIFETSDDDDEEPELLRCKNPRCNRFAGSETDYCCESCREAEVEGVLIGEAGHCPECAYRHSQLYAERKWDPTETY